MNRWLPVIALTVPLTACGLTDPIEGRAADQLTDCMLGNGGVRATGVRFSIEDRSIARVEVSYLGQGSSLYDAVYESCLATVADELELIVE